SVIKDPVVPDRLLKVKEHQMTEQTNLHRRFATAAIASFVLFAALAGLWLGAGNTSARAGSPPPDLPQFDGTSITEIFPVGQPAASSVAPRAKATLAGWEAIFGEDWEAGFDGDIWLTYDRNGAQDG